MANFADGIRLMTALQESARISETLNKTVKVLHETADKVKDEAEKKVTELAPVNKEANDSTVKSYLEDFTKSMQEVSNRCDKVIEKCQPVQVQSKEVMDFYSSDSDVTLDDIKTLIRKLQDLRSSADSLYSLFFGLKESVVEAENALKDLRTHCGIEAEKADGKERTISVGGGVGSGAAGGAAVGLGIAGIFFPPLLIGAAVCGAGAVAGGVATGINANNMKKLKESFNQLKTALDGVVKNLSKIGDKIRAGVQATAKLITMLENADRRAKNIEDGMLKQEMEKLRKRFDNL
ncbi:hypothetical protein BOX15_Mlig022356g1 [Macrostomum lignano]|uniref:Uncharacterized protein n=1 Tax=Macrostomum lignano TaxID=282301 RepID=A0A267G8D0_9PLAT|nr:hypothetical protein BOX15_Mlig022356g1 [Macrostomum lignano]